MDREAFDLTDSETITCPSGLTGVVRNLTVGESRILTGKSRSGAQLGTLLSTCWLQTLDPGPYTLSDGKVPWDEVLLGDRFYVLLHVRMLTYGAEYAFAVACSNRACGRRVDWTLNLADLPVRSLSAESRQAFAQGNRFEASLPGERRAAFGLLIGKDETRMARLQGTGDDAVLSRLLAMRVQDVTGVPPQQKNAFLERLSLQQARLLLTAFEKADCGVDTEIEIGCPHCGYPQQVDLPLDQNFLWPDLKRAGGSSQSPA